MALTNFEEIKTKYQHKISKDEEVSCRVLAKIKDGFLVNVNDEWEGFIHVNHALFNYEGDIPQEPFKALITSGPDKSDRYAISQKALREKGLWEMLENLKNEDRPLRVKISKVIKGGVEVYIDSLRAFLPGRYVRLPGLSPEGWVNQEIDVLIEELDRKERKIILNQKKALDLQREAKAENALTSLKEGDIIEAPILRIAEFGVFVDLGGIDGLVPASELSFGRFNHPKEVVKEGQILKGRIFRIEREKRRIALSVKQLLGDPWENFSSEFKIGEVYSGKVVNDTSFGLFVELKPGVEGLIHNTEVPQEMERPKAGDLIKVKIIKTDLDQKKIGLTLRDVKENTEVHEATSEQNRQSSLNGHPSVSTEYFEADNELSLAAPQISLESFALTESKSES